jgi:hypothetical protein
MSPMNRVRRGKGQAARVTCAKCDRPVGRLTASIVRPYSVELMNDGVSIVCSDKGSCKVAQLSSA